MVSLAPRDEGSPAGGFDWQTDGLKLLKGAAIVAAGAVLTYLVEAIPNVDLGPTWTPLVVGVSSVVVNFLRKWLGNTAKTVQNRRVW